MKTSGEVWLFNFLRDPSFDEGAKKSVQLGKMIGEDPRANTGSLMVISGFFGQMIARYPDRMEEWAHAYLGHLKLEDQTCRTILWLSLSLSQVSGVKELLVQIPSISSVDSGERSNALQLLELGDISVIEPAEAWMLDLLWGCFFGSGDPKYLERILLCLSWVENESCSVKKRSIGMAAFTSIAQNRRDHTSVLTATSAVFIKKPDLRQMMIDIDNLLKES